MNIHVAPTPAKARQEAIRHEASIHAMRDAITAHRTARAETNDKVSAADARKDHKEVMRLHNAEAAAFKHLIDLVPCCWSELVAYAGYMAELAKSDPDFALGYGDASECPGIVLERIMCSLHSGIAKMAPLVELAQKEAVERLLRRDPPRPNAVKKLAHREAPRKRRAVRRAA
jgi:hypothetical protein